MDVKRLVRMIKKYDEVPDHLYHYTDGNNVELIVFPDKIHFRLTRIDLQKDKFEGKTSETFWERAVKQLFDEGCITEEEIELLLTLEAGPQHLFAFNNEIGNVYKDPADVYLLCFSTEKNDDYMYENYAKHEGFCLHFFSYRLNDVNNMLRSKVCKKTLRKVLYELDAIDCFKKDILEIRDICQGFQTEDFENLGKGVLRHLKAMATYNTKLEKFRKENEVRLMIFLPKNDNNSSIHMDSDDDYIFLDFTCHSLWGYAHQSKGDMDKINKIANRLESMSYHIEN